MWRLPLPSLLYSPLRSPSLRSRLPKDPKPRFGFRERCLLPQWGLLPPTILVHFEDLEKLLMTALADTRRGVARGQCPQSLDIFFKECFFMRF